MEKQFKLFLEFLQNDKKASENTLQSYRRDIVFYNKYVEANKINFAKVSVEDIKKYLEHLQEIKKRSNRWNTIT
jgi:integrase/recombinase XerD